MDIISESEALNTNLEFVCTHNGTFHADDVMSCAILDILCVNPVCRTRRQHILKKAYMCFDVGMKYNKQNKIFDHHQNPTPLRPDKFPYSSAGLIWKEYGKAVIHEIDTTLSEFEIESIWKQIDSELMLSIDLIDNGITERDYKTLSFSAFIGSFNLSWDDTGSTTDTQFIKAVEQCKLFLIRSIRSKLSQKLAKQIVLNSDRIFNNTILVLPNFCPWQRVIFEEKITNLIFCIYPTETDWRLQTIPCKPKSYSMRKSLPVKWKGRTQSELVEITQVSDVIFCHTGLFICSAESYSGIVKLAELALL